MFKNRHLTTWVCVAGFCLIGLLSPCQAWAQIVTSATGQIDLKLSSYFGGDPSQTLIQPLGLNDASAWIDGAGYFSAGGLSQIDFNVLTDGPAQTWFTTYAIAETLDPADGGGGHAGVDLSFYAQAPFYYRFEATSNDPYGGFSVEFNGQSASAYYDFANGFPDGTFPMIYFDYGGTYYPVGWDTYVDEGFLPAGLYEFSVVASSGVYRSNAQNTHAHATMLIQMQGDANLDGFVGVDDLDAVLANWNDHVPVGAVQFGDLSHDGFVGVDDLDQVLANWNHSVQPPIIVVPEPASLILLGAISLVLPAMRRRHLSCRT